MAKGKRPEKTGMQARPFFCLRVHMGYNIYTRMKQNRAFVGMDRDRWLRDLGRLWPVAKGSLSEVRKPCTRSNCAACREGRGHRVFLFSYREGGRRRCAYVPANLAPLVRRAIANGRAVEQRLAAEGRALIAARGTTRGK